MPHIADQFPAAWRPLAEDFLRSEQAQHLSAFLDQEVAAGQTLFPPAEQRFAALEAVAPEQVRVVILGQDPYHGPGQAMGLCFSVPQGVRVPPSLQNIYKELADDIGFRIPDHGDLTHWAEQGVLLLNSVLSVRAGDAGSHANQGWETLTDQLVHGLAREREHLVFMLWGSYAQRKAAGVDTERHLVLKAPHPSPLSAYRGFMGCEHFSQANTWLHATGQPPIDWQLF
ncbi:uracil-DNA glycosylase [Natronospirillum operosum]|uniref:Uracil-DNA glycosylase n=1 Tax=Natronospirillum operosum TaxID=2759953 RepID=A0A4Z0WBW7_9GAMM|nr:uracil-DNA glycosylase [Natronospirillum operosum]TGG92375.1 uracil-DNA glycosylase [Natronospirillum operosum]